MTLARFFALTAAGSLSLFASDLAAQSTNVPLDEGFAVDPYEPSPAGDGFFVLPDARVEGATDFRGRADFVVAYRPLLRRTHPATGERVDVVSRVIAVHPGASLALVDRLLVETSLPLASVGSDVDEVESGFGVGDLRIGARGELYASNGVDFALGTTAWLPTGSEDALLGDGSVRAEIDAIGGGRIGSIFVWSAELGIGARERPASRFAEPASSLVFGGGVGALLLEERLRVGLELSGAAWFPAAGSESGLFGSGLTPMVGLAGAKYRAGDFVGGLALGPGLGKAAGTSPRFVLGVAYAPARAEPAVAPAEAEPAATQPAPAALPPAPTAAPATAPSVPPREPPPPTPPEQGPTQADLERARELFRKGVEAYDADRFEEARAAFEESYAISAHPAVLLNLAESELRSGRKEAACTHFRAWKARELAPTEDQKATAEAGIAEACAP